MAESSINVTPGTGGPNIDLYTVDNGSSRQVVCIGDPATGTKVASIGQAAMASSLPVAIASDQSAVSITGTVTRPAATLAISATGTTGAAVTATLPAVAGQFHYITLIQIKKYFTAANAASATPLVITTTNLPGSLAFTFGQPAGAIGATDEDIFANAADFKSSVVNTATTIVAPATTGIIWRINVLYYAAP